jgi:hypothetical protein
MSDLHKEVIFDARKESPEAIAAGIRKRGIAYVKNVLDLRMLTYCSKAMRLNSRDLRDLLGKEINFMPLCFTDRYLDGETQPPGFNSNDLKAFDTPLAFSKMDRSWYYEGAKQYKLWFWQNGLKLPNLLLRAMMDSRLPEIYRAYFGTSCVSPYEHDAIHYQRPDNKELFYPFHQDGSYFSREPKDHSGITTWLPLTDCGIDSPGLEVYPYRLVEVLDPPKGKPMPYTFVDDDEVLERFGDKLWAPPIKAGDCLVFDNFLIHRTAVTPDMTKERQSADIRVFSAQNMPDYVNLYKGWMVDIA